MKVLIVLSVCVAALSAFPQNPTNNLSKYFVHPVDRARNAGIGGRIVGGNEVKPHSLPYQVGLFIATNVFEEFCGGSLIAPNYVLTAAHCLERAVAVEVVLGAHRINSLQEPEQFRTTSTDFIIHEGWNNAYVDDIGLVRLSDNVQLTDNIKTIKLASDKGNLYVGDIGRASGWGLISPTAPTPLNPTLMAVENDILSNEECRNTPPFNDIVKDGHLCLNGAGMKGTCLGDSGGPLVVDGVQVGIVSFGYRYCTAAKPSVFTRITTYIDWIMEHTNNSTEILNG